MKVISIGQLPQLHLKDLDTLPYEPHSQKDDVGPSMRVVQVQGGGGVWP